MYWHWRIKYNHEQFSFTKHNCLILSLQLITTKTISFQKCKLKWKNLAILNTNIPSLYKFPTMYHIIHLVEDPQNGMHWYFDGGWGFEQHFMLSSIYSLPSISLSRIMHHFTDCKSKSCIIQHCIVPPSTHGKGSTPTQHSANLGHTYKSHVPPTTIVMSYIVATMQPGYLMEFNVKVSITRGETST